MLTDLHEILELGVVAPTREPDVFAIWQRGRRRRIRRRLAASMVAVTVVAGAAVAVLSSAATDHKPSLHVTGTTGTSTGTTGAPPEKWTTFRDAAHGLAISFPSSWQAAPSTLTPALADPIVPLAVGTYPLQPEQPHECDIVPQRALEALGPTDAFVAVYLYQGSASFGSQLERPAHFSPDLFPSQLIQCTENVHGTVKSLGFLDHGRKISVMIAVGSNASPKSQDEVYRILDTLVVNP